MTPLLSATLLRTQSDARLVALVRQGHERAFEAIVERYRRPLHRHIRRILPESRAEDAIQQTFLKTWSSLQEGAEISELRPWLYRIAQNTSLDALKRAGYDYDELSESLRSPGGPEADLARRPRPAGWRTAAPGKRGRPRADRRRMAPVPAVRVVVDAAGRRIGRAARAHRVPAARALVSTSGPGATAAEAASRESTARRPPA